MGLSRFLRRFRQADGGASAVEFAIVAPLFLVLTLSAFEGGWLMVRTVMQDVALRQVVRDLRISTETTITADSVKAAICDHSFVFVDCEQMTMVEMLPLQNASSEIPTDRARCRHRGSAPPFRPGGRAEFMFLRICTTVSPITPFLGLAVALRDSESGEYGIISQTAFVNEPA